jgi:hypothetical protein
MCVTGPLHTNAEAEVLGEMRRRLPGSGRRCSRPTSADDSWDSASNSRSSACGRRSLTGVASTHRSGPTWRGARTTSRSGRRAGPESARSQASSHGPIGQTVRSLVSELATAIPRPPNRGPASSSSEAGPFFVLSGGRWFA